MHREADRLRVFGRRAALLAAGKLGLFGLLGARLHYLQVTNADQYALLADENRINHRLLPPARGRVLDRHGTALARNVPIYRVRVVREQAKDVARTLHALARLIPLSPERIEQVVAEASRRRAFVPIAVREDLSWDEVARVAVHAPDLPGIMLDSGLLRDYPAGDILAHVVGYVGPVSEAELTGEPLLELPEFRHGKAGIERVYNDLLRGAAGISRFEVNALGREIKELQRRDGEPGQDLELTLDLDLQRFVHQRLAGEPSASAVVLDVQSGEVLALASVPSFEPGAFTNGLSRTAWRALLANPQTPLVNKAISGLYPPGSTFKMVVALAALEAGVVSPETEVHCPGHMELGNHRFHCWRRWGHGPMKLIPAIAQSCDVYFYEVARRVGVDTIAEMSRRFGLGEVTGLDLPGEKGGLVPDRAWKRAARGEPWHQGETLVVGIGQGYLQTTPLQLAVMTARIANGGRAIRPRLARLPQGLAAAAPERLQVSDWALRLVRQGMDEVVNAQRGTAYTSRLADPEHAMAGKTGTSQVRRISRAERLTGVRRNEDRPWQERDHALFVAYAPSRNPRFAVSVVVEHGGSGSQAAAPIARDIIARTLELDPTRPRGLPTADADGPPTPRQAG
jgi:penicillin-binding protein 2